ncbi:MAG: type I-C CRISPR-associated protein Cas5c [Chloroflexota bacterium]
MTVGHPPLEVKFWADYACFTRPEMKVERVSYPVPTPSAIEGALCSILWKPEMTWQVVEVWVLNPIKYASILRNEVNSLALESSARAWEREGGGFVASRDRAQRHTLALRDVAYLVKAHAVPKSGADADFAKYRDQFRRRVERGRCFATPYLGCREFSASFGPVAGDEQPIDRTEELGPMLLRINYASGTSGRGAPEFFEARLDDGILRVPLPALGDDSHAVA